MSHRKFEHPRHGSLGFLPRKRASRHRGKGTHASLTPLADSCFFTVPGFVYVSLSMIVVLTRTVVSSKDQRLIYSRRFD